MLYTTIASGLAEQSDVYSMVRTRKVGAYIYPHGETAGEKNGHNLLSPLGASEGMGEGEGVWRDGRRAKGDRRGATKSRGGGTGEGAKGTRPRTAAKTQGATSRRAKEAAADRGGQDGAGAEAKGAPRKAGGRGRGRGRGPGREQSGRGGAPSARPTAPTGREGGRISRAQQAHTVGTAWAHRIRMGSP